MTAALRAAALDALEALIELADRGVKAKATLDRDLPDGSPVHPVSGSLTWPLSTAGLAIDKLRAVLAAPALAEPDMRHPKIQALIGGNARKSIEMQLIEQLLDEGPDCELTAMDMEYWNSTHDKLQEALMKQAEPVAWVNSANLASARRARERGGPFDQHTWSEAQTTYHDRPLYTHPAAPDLVPLTQAQIVAAARALNKRHALLCNVNEADSWAIQGGDFLDDARAALDAAGIGSKP